MVLEEYHIDEDLVEGLRAGQEEALTVLYRKYWEGMYNAAYKRLKDRELVQDLIQDVFTDLWQRRSSVAIYNIGGYLHTAVQYQVYKVISRRAAGPAFFELFEHIGASSYHADEPIRNKEFIGLVVAWIETLPAKRRQVFKLHFVDNLTPGEIAERLGVSPKTVRNQLGTSLESFRLELSQFLSLLLL